MSGKERFFLFAVLIVSSIIVIAAVCWLYQEAVNFVAVSMAAVDTYDEKLGFRGLLPVLVFFGAILMAIALCELIKFYRWWKKSYITQKELLYPVTQVAVLIAPALLIEFMSNSANGCILMFLFFLVCYAEATRMTMKIWDLVDEDIMMKKLFPRIN